MKNETMEQNAQSCIDLLVVAGHLVIIVALAISALRDRRDADHVPAAPAMSILESLQVDENGLPRK